MYYYLQLQVIYIIFAENLKSTDYEKKGISIFKGFY